VAVGGRSSSERRLVSSILLSVPRHDEQPQTITEIAQRVVRQHDSAVAKGHVDTSVDIVLVFLTTFDVLSEQGGRYRCRGEMPSFFLRSLAWYIENGRPIVNNWMRPGIGDDLPIDALLDAAPYLLRLIEAKRHHLAGATAEPIRRRRLACVLVKTVVDGRAYFLLEWDRAAAQYQLIGGGIRADEAPEAAATQEFIEELVIEPGQRLVSGRDFVIRPLGWDRPPPIEWTGVSRTVGALTRYETWVYGTTLSIDSLKLDEGYR